ncbi:permease-like cell division protein FtsX [Patescibacteria group bacterium]|nr:permease-like cell division protein FtsX [Patescibacteria group bacterium]
MINLLRIFKYGFQNFWRNGLLSVATTLVLTLTLFTVSVFVAITLFANAAVESINSRIDVVVYFNDETPDSEIARIEGEVKKLSNVRETTYISKDAALDKWVSKTEDQSLKNAITSENNPLPRSLEIKISDPEKTHEVADYFNQETIKPMVHRVRYNKEVIDKLVRYTSAFKKIGLGLVVIFIIISIFVVFNTIRLAIYSRRDEIEIMQLVGATPSYIRWPFVVEGTLFGIFAALLASLLIIFGGKYLFSSGIIPATSLNEVLNFLGPEAAKYFSGASASIILYQVIVGILLSVVCSMVAIRRYLKI